jgi:hypothetical protein
MYVSNVCRRSSVGLLLDLGPSVSKAHRAIEHRLFAVESLSRRNIRAARTDIVCQAPPLEPTARACTRAALRATRIQVRREVCPSSTSFGFSRVNRVSYTRTSLSTGMGRRNPVNRRLHLAAIGALPPRVAGS